jgi:hypothetical protein
MATTKGGAKSGKNAKSTAMGLKKKPAAAGKSKTARAGTP